MKYLSYILGGYYCDINGLSEPTGPCAPGYYCDGGSTTAMPSGVGGNQCTTGSYCPEASANPTPCDPGYYCANNLLNETSGKCSPGYYCTSMATVANPTDGTTGTSHSLLLTYYFEVGLCALLYSNTTVHETF